MKKLLCATVLGGALSLGALTAYAHEAVQNHGLLKASYALPKHAGEKIRNGLHEADAENKNTYDAIVSDRADLYDILTAPEFSRDAFLSKTKDLREQQMQSKENRDEALASSLIQLSQKDRQAFADAIENAGQHKKK